ncbi:hypothetical protein LPJ76_006102 [Coemansia sp. RSA 638]|nr:hypothetical protein LPJ76_006102 [Coemansia sp. RSA 638]
MSKRRSGDMKPEYDIKPVLKSEDPGATSDSSASSSVKSAKVLLDTPDAITLSDSDSDSDGLVDALGLLGPPEFEPSVRNSPHTPSQVSTPSTPITTTPYRNSLKSLAQTSRQQKYNLGFLEQHMNYESSSEDESEPYNSNTRFESALNVLPQEDVERVRVQLGTGKEVLQKSIQASLFSRSRLDSTLGHLPYGRGRFDDIIFATDDPIERLCQAHIGDPSFFRHLIVSSWIESQASSGWKLTQSVGDILLRAMCLDNDNLIAACAYKALRLFLDLKMSTWELRYTSLLMLMEELQGVLCSQALEVESSSNDDKGVSSQNSSLSVYVDIVVPSTLSITRSNAERVAYLVEIASMSLEFLSVDDSCHMLVMLFGSLLDYRNQICSARIQQGLAILVNRISPPSKWMLVWPECVARLGKLFLQTPLPMQLHVTDRLPISNTRCMQIRHSLSFLFLRLQTSDYIMADHSIESLATSAVLPAQIILRIVSEMMDSSEEIFRVGPDTDFVRLEAAVGLLSNVLDSVQAMRGVRDEAESIYHRLNNMSQRINEGLADRLDKTLAKDTIQALMVRVFMTALSDNPTGKPVNNLDDWLRQPTMCNDSQ